jgi:hypothetical protein
VSFFTVAAGEAARGRGNMRRVLLATVIAIAAVALYATTAPAGQQAVTPKQFAALTKRVAKLEKDDKGLTAAIQIIGACVFDKGAIPTTKTPQYHTTGTGEATDFYVLTTNNQDCVRIINSPVARRILKAAGH